MHQCLPDLCRGLLLRVPVDGSVDEGRQREMAEFAGHVFDLLKREVANQVIEHRANGRLDPVA